MIHHAMPQPSLNASSQLLRQLFFQSHDVVAHEVYGEDAIRVTPPPPQTAALHSSSNTSCLMNPSTPPAQNAALATSSSLMHDRGAMLQHQSSDSIESNLGPNGHIMQFPGQHATSSFPPPSAHGGATNINNDLIPVSLRRPSTLLRHFFYYYY